MKVNYAVGIRYNRRTTTVEELEENILKVLQEFKDIEKDGAGKIYNWCLSGSEDGEKGSFEVRSTRGDK